MGRQNLNKHLYAAYIPPQFQPTGDLPVGESS
jgi:hypothetical protein